MKRQYFLFVMMFFGFSISPGFAMPDEEGEEETIISVFKNHHINFGDGSDQHDGVTASYKGRQLYRTLTLPESEEPTSITLRVRIKAKNTSEKLGDPWDKFGTVSLLSPGDPDIELMRFITGFGVGRKDQPVHPSVEAWADDVVWEQDVSALAKRLSGEVTIMAMVDTWVKPGWDITVDLIYKPMADKKAAFWTLPVLNTRGNARNADQFSSTSPKVSFTVPENAGPVSMTLYTTGHGGNNGDEFHKKVNVVYVDDEEFVRFIPWRDDCKNFRKYNPTSAKWENQTLWSSDLSRSGWCPGDIVYPIVYDMSKALEPGRHTIRFNVENVNPEGGNGWNYSVRLSGPGVEQTTPAERIKTSLAHGNIPVIQTGAASRVLVEAVDGQGRTVHSPESSVKVTVSDGAEVSADGKEYASEAVLPAGQSSALLYIRKSEPGDFTLNASDMSAPGLANAEALALTAYDNLPSRWKRTDGAFEAGYPVTGIVANKFKEKNDPHRLADRSTGKKWVATLKKNETAEATVTFDGVRQANTFVINHFVSVRDKAGQDPGHLELGFVGEDDGRFVLGTFEEHNSEPGTCLHALTLETPVRFKKLLVRMKRSSSHAAAQADVNIAELFAYELPEAEKEAFAETMSTDPNGKASAEPVLTGVFDGPSVSFGCHPNPVSDFTEVSLELPYRSGLTVQVFGPGGGLVKTLAQGVFNSGAYSYRWSPERAGLYVVLVRQTLPDGTEKVYSEKVLVRGS
ncbi:hypothetical protein FUAX_50430 (plasmid) [Fulvitalea axinellae]|uniref:Peptide-N-glycosidase F N-terminal domain-containing protein n=1 Tax=Fulvitalea axinellae TaxID=1182444 RepID=A0AAU9DHN3_9BACT|nr:hypothetical protein FUAX_50430 [Fulvitalea axinellae]